MKSLGCFRSSSLAAVLLLAAVFAPFDQTVMASSAVQEYALLSSSERNDLREQAVIEARAGHYDKALPVLRDLYHSDIGDIKTAYDYMTILHWAGRNQEAVDVYEAGSYADAPEYVVLNAASAYYRLNQYDKTLELLEPLTHQGSRDAVTLQAQVYIRQNNPNLAEEYFDRILGDADEEEVLRIKTETAIGLHNWQWPAALWRKALLDKEKGMYPGLSRTELVDNLSVAYLRIGRPKDALRLLKPYINDKTAVVNMIGNYIMGLRQIKHYRKAIEVYQTFFGGVNDVPVFILREVAECFYQRGNYTTAAKIYAYIQEKGYAVREDKFRLGYIGCHTKEYRERGIAAYAEILDNYRSSYAITRTLVEASDILQHGRLYEADHVYRMLIAFDERFRRLYIDDLLREDQYQTAWHVAGEMLQSKSEQLVDLAKEKISAMAVALRDYQTAADYEKQLAEKLDEEYAYSEASGTFKNKLQGECYVYTNTYNDHDDSDSREYGVYATQYLGDSLWGEFEAGKTYVKEHGRTVGVDMNKLGLRYTTRKFDNLIGASLYRAAGCDKMGLRVDSLFRPDDKQELHFTYDNTPVADPDALEYELGTIYADKFALRYTYHTSQFESYYAELRQNNYDFDNKMKGWSIGQELQIYNDFNKGRTLKRSIHWSRDRYSNQDVPYTSPELQESVGIEWKWGREFNHDDVLFHVVGFNWEKDYPDPFTLNPFVRVEYQRAFSKHQYLTVGCGYSMQSESSLGEGSWKFNNNNFDITYNLTW